MKMNYEIVNLKQKTIVGISAETSDGDPEMTKIIGQLWTRFYENSMGASIKHKVNERSIGLYSDYSEEGYCVTVGNEVSEVELEAGAEGCIVKRIPSGRYAKFSVCGNMQRAVAEAWTEIWKMELDRSFAADFEEYLNDDWENGKIDIYIALK